MCTDYCENSPNCEHVREATLLFISQLKLRKENVVANINALVQEEHFHLVIVDDTKVSDFEEPDEMLWDIPKEMKGA